MISEKEIDEMSKDEPSWMRIQRKINFANFLSLPELFFKYGKDISITPAIDFNSFEPLSRPKDFITAPDGIEIFRFGEAFKKYTNLNNLLDNGFALDKALAFHNAFVQECFVIRIPERKKFQVPIVINFSGSGIRNLIVFAEPYSEARILEVSEKAQSGGFRSVNVSLFLSEAVDISYSSVLNLNGENSFTRRKAVVLQNSKLRWVDFFSGGKFQQVLTRNFLVGAGAKCDYLAGLHGIGAEIFDINPEMVHEAPRSECEVLVKAVLEGETRAIIRGLIEIKNGMENCKGYQKTDALLLSEKARADVVPRLDIMNNEVKCTHGASIGRIGVEEMFYLMSRGLVEKEAKKLVMEGFFSKVLDVLKSMNEDWRMKATSSTKDI